MTKVCQDKTFVMTNVLSQQTLSQLKFCHDEHIFVMTKEVFCHDRHVCHNKILVAAPTNNTVHPDHLMKMTMEY